jgi:hypothetical protein
MFAILQHLLSLVNRKFNSIFLTLHSGFFGCVFFGGHLYFTLMKFIGGVFLFWGFVLGVDIFFFRVTMFERLTMIYLLSASVFAFYFYGFRNQDAVCSA